MSTSLSAVCDHCRIRCHFGQLGSAGSSLAFGGTEWPREAAPILRFTMEHAYCDLAVGVRIVITDVAHDRACDSYTEWQWFEHETYPEPNE